MTRRVYAALGALAALVLSALSLVWVLDDGIIIGTLTSEQVDLILIGFWLLVPPLFFWLDWVWFCRNIPHGSDERRTISHTHTLSRNIWVAFVALLFLLFYLQQLAWQSQDDDGADPAVAQEQS
jgi:hypothetical protein